MLRARGDEGQPGAGGSPEADRRAQEGDAGADRACLAVGAEALDRPHTGNDQARPSEREFKAADVELTEDDLNEIEKAGAAIKVEGKRYPLHLTANTVRDHRADGTASEDSGPVSLPVTFRLDLALHWEDSSVTISLVRSFRSMAGTIGPRDVR